MSGNRTKKKSIPDKCRSCMICYPKPKKDNNPNSSNSNSDHRNNNTDK